MSTQTGLIILAIVFVAITALPAVIYKTMRLDPRREIEPVDPEQLPSVAVASWYAELTAALAREGFVSCGCWLLKDPYSATLIYLLVLVNEEKKMEAAGIYSICKTEHATIEARFLEVTTRDLDHRLVSTCNNGRDAGVFPRHPDVAKWYAPWLVDPVKLVRAHHLLASHSDLGVRDRVCTRDNLAQRAQEGMLREVARAVERGALKRVDEHLCRPTMWGAFTMTWRLLPPVKQIVFWLATSRTRARLRDLGANDLAQ